MKALLNDTSARVWALIAVPLVVLAGPVFAAVFPAIVRAVVPETVRTILSLL